MAPGTRNADQDAAAATAAFKVLLAHLPQHKAVLEESYTLAMAGIPNSAAKEAGRLIGEKAAEAAMTAGGIDPAIGQGHYRPITAKPGQWVPTALPSIELLSDGVPPLGDGQRVRVAAAAAAGVHQPGLGAGLRRSAPAGIEGKHGANARADLGRALPPGRRHHPGNAPAPPTRRGARPCRTRGCSPSIRWFSTTRSWPWRTPRTHYDFWRPVTAIRNGEGDGNPATPPDAGWTPLLSTPNFAEYPCGHCIVAAAAGAVMKAETGARPAGGVRINSMLMPNAATQVFPSWDEWSQQVSDSRIYGGVHYRFSNEAGEEMGRGAARTVMDKIMRPLPRK